MSRHFEFFDDLRQMPISQAQIVSRRQLNDILPHYWREENVSGPEEWFINTGRGLGFDIRYNLERDYFTVRLEQRASASR